MDCYYCTIYFSAIVSTGRWCQWCPRWWWGRWCWELCGMFRFHFCCPMYDNCSSLICYHTHIHFCTLFLWQGSSVTKGTSDIAAGIVHSKVKAKDWRHELKLDKGGKYYPIMILMLSFQYDVYLTLPSYFTFIFFLDIIFDVDGNDADDQNQSEDTQLKTYGKKSGYVCHLWYMLYRLFEVQQRI